MTTDFPITTEILRQGIYSGIRWVAAHAPIYGAVNGYVRLPDGHPWLEVDDLWDIKTSVPWGEITYSSGNWIGFDTLHAGQFWPGQAEYGSRRYHDDTLMTPEMVYGWCELLAREAADYINNGTYQI